MGNPSSADPSRASGGRPGRSKATPLPLRRGLRLLLGLGLAIVLVEGLLRLLGVSMPPPALYPGDVEPVRDASYDSRLGWKLPPGREIPETTPDFSVVYRSNAQGFRSDREFSSPGSGDRIVFLGDSFTFGTGVEPEETFAERVASARGARAVNLGIGGYGIDQMWLSLIHHGLDLEPAWVVLAFIRNDLDRSLSAYRKGHVWQEKPLFRLSDGELVPMTSETRPGALRSWVVQNSRWAGLWRRVENSLARRWAIGYRWRLNRALFAAVRDTCRAAGVPLLVVHLPVNRRHPVPLFEREFARLGIDYLDLTPLVGGDGDRLYFPNDHHFNAAGHRFAAEAIVERLPMAGVDG